MVESNHTAEAVWEYLNTIPDPEIPALSIVDLNIVRSVEVRGEDVDVGITPTFIGCPATDAIAESVRDILLLKGFKNVRVTKAYGAQWSTDFLSESSRDKMETFGIAPPTPVSTVSLEFPTICPYCKSPDTRLENPFGATLCKQLYYCNACLQSFEKFKSL